MPLALEDKQEILQLIREEFPDFRLSPSQALELQLRERIVRVEEELRHQRELMLEGFKRMDNRFDASEKRFKDLMHYMDKRFETVDKQFEAVDKRFEAVDKRFEAVDKRFEDLVHYMDKRFEDLLHYMDKRFEAVNKRLSILQWSILFGFSILSVFLGYLTFIVKATS